MKKGRKILYLSKADVISIGLKLYDVIELLEGAFKEKGRGQVEMPPKPGIHPGDGDNFIHAMPAYIPALHSAGVKWVSGYPGNSRRGYPYISGLLILNDPETGLPLTVMDCEWITAVRTAAATAVAAKRLARSDADTLGVLGCGVQGSFNVKALVEVLPIKKVYAYDIRLESAERFRQNIANELKLEVIPVNTPRDAVTGCSVVVTAGPILKKPHRTIQAGWLDPGAFAVPLDFDSYWDPAAMKEVDKFCTDDKRQFEYYKDAGYFKGAPPVYADLGELTIGSKPGRESDLERTMACNLGLALEDMAVAPTIYRRAVDRGIGTWLPC